MARKKSTSVVTDKRLIQEVRERLMKTIQDRGIVLNERTTEILKNFTLLPDTTIYSMNNGIDVTTKKGMLRYDMFINLDGSCSNGFSYGAL